LILVALVFGATLSPPVLAFFPVLFAAVYLFIWWRPPTITALLMADSFIFFAIPLLISQSVPDYFSWLVGLPVLVLIEYDLETIGSTAGYNQISYLRSPTRILLAMFFTLVSVLIVSVVLDSMVLLACCGVAFVLMVLLVITAYRRMPRKPVTENIIEARVIAGSQAKLSIVLTPTKGAIGKLFLEPMQDWIKLPSSEFLVNEQEISVQVYLIPSLSGASAVRLKGYAIDKWGLWQTHFIIEPVRLIVIPRARYASWLAKRYLAESSTGMLPMISTLSNLHPLYGFRAGIEYYGSRYYEPGDSLKNIDWKHMAKYNKLISKEFADLHGNPAILLVNLAVSNTDEMDKQVYNIIVAALSLAREQIPTALALYDENNVRLVTAALQPQMLVASCLNLTKEVKTVSIPTKYLEPADLRILHGNIHRLQSLESNPAKSLSQLLQVEYQVLRKSAVQHPATKALEVAFKKIGSRSNIIAVSPLNHDAEAIMLNTINYRKSGNAVITI